jgi:hypothetical protein
LIGAADFMSRFFVVYLSKHGRQTGISFRTVSPYWISRSTQYGHILGFLARGMNGWYFGTPLFWQVQLAGR